MTPNDISLIKLAEKPCNIKHLEEYDQFLIGTYEQISRDEIKIKLPELIEADDICLDEKLDSLNHRFGSLAIIKRRPSRDDCRSLGPFQNHLSARCTEGGGVFDLCTYYKKSESSYVIYVAHANGFFCSYRYNHIEGIKPLELHRLNGSKMLTSIDYISTDEITEAYQDISSSEKKALFQEVVLVVGDSEGRIMILDDNGIVKTTLNVTPFKDPVWQVKFLKIKAGNDNSKSCFVIVATEDASWMLLEYNCTANELIKIYKNDREDFSAGVTSISILASPVTNLAPTPNDNQICDISDCVQFNLLLGSYDETIKLYSLSFLSKQSDSDNDIPSGRRISFERVARLGETSIPGGGIWRMNCFLSRGKNNTDNHSSEWDLYVAAMYAGSYLIKMNLFHQNTHTFGLETDETSLEQGACVRFGQPKSLLNFDPGDLELPKDPLHYGVDLSVDRSFYCIADFNNSLCYLAANNLPDE